MIKSTFLNRREACAAALAMSFPFAYAQEKFPSKLIRILLPLGPGSGTDTLTRALGEALTNELNVPFSIENRPGAGGTIAATQLARSKADGYTIGVFPSTAFGPAVAVNDKLPYDPIKDFTPLAVIASTPMALAVPMNSPYTSLEEIVKAAHSEPGKLTVGFTGTAASEKDGFDLLDPLPDVPFIRVPFAGGTGPMLTSVLGNQIDAVSVVWAAMAPLVRSGRLRLLASSAAIKEAPAHLFNKAVAQPHLDVRTFLVAPAGLSEAAQAVLLPAISNALVQPKTLGVLERQGYIVSFGGPQEVRSIMRSEIDVFKSLVEKARKRN